MRWLPWLLLAALVWLGWTAWRLAPQAPIAPGDSSSDPAAAPPLLVYCAASNRPVLEAVAADYEREFGERIELQFGASQTLLSALEVSRTGDVYLPADDSYIVQAQERGLVGESAALAEMHAVVAVAQGNPLGVARLADLLRDDVRLVQANPDAAAIGLLTRRTLDPQGLWAPLAARTLSYKGTVNDAANDVAVGAADAAIVWDVVVSAYSALEAVAAPELATVTARIAAAVTKASAAPDRAWRFVRYLAAADRGQVRYREHGFTTLGESPWSE